jgi:hypothetical protein
MPEGIVKLPELVNVTVQVVPESEPPTEVHAVAAEAVPSESTTIAEAREPISRVKAVTNLRVRRNAKCWPLAKKILSWALALNFQ